MICDDLEPILLSKNTLFYLNPYREIKVILVEKLIDLCIKGCLRRKKEKKASCTIFKEIHTVKKLNPSAIWSF